MWSFKDKQLDATSRLKLTSDLLKESHNRCKAHNLKKNPNRPIHRLSDAEHLVLTQQLSPIKLAMAASFYVLLRVLPGDEKFCLVTDSRGYIIDMCGKEHILKAAADMQISNGVLFDEATFGTTAVSLALRHNIPVYLSGDEHYCSIFHKSECLGVPLFDSNNNVFASIGICSYLGSSLANDIVLEIVSKFMSRLDFLNDKNDQETCLTKLSPSADSHTLLSRRQLQVIQLRANGYLNKQIANKLEIHLDTVKEHVSAALKRLRVRSVAEAVLFLSERSSHKSGITWINQKK